MYGTLINNHYLTNHFLGLGTVLSVGWIDEEETTAKTSLERRVSAFCATGEGTRRETVQKIGIGVTRGLIEEATIAIATEEATEDQELLIPTTDVEGEDIGGDHTTVDEIVEIDRMTKVLIEKDLEVEATETSQEMAEEVGLPATAGTEEMGLTRGIEIDSVGEETTVEVDLIVETDLTVGIEDMVLLEEIRKTAGEEVAKIAGIEETIVVTEEVKVQEEMPVKAEET